MTSLYIAANQMYNIIVEGSGNDIVTARQIYNESYDEALSNTTREEKNLIHLIFNEVWKILSENFRSQGWSIFDTTLHI